MNKSNPITKFNKKNKNKLTQNKIPEDELISNKILEKYFKFIKDNNITDSLLNTFNNVKVDKWTKVTYTKEDYEKYYINEEYPTYNLFYTFTNDTNDILKFKYEYSPGAWNEHYSNAEINNDELFHTNTDSGYNCGWCKYTYNKYNIPYWDEKGKTLVNTMENLSIYLYIKYKK